MADQRPSRRRRIAAVVVMVAACVALAATSPAQIESVLSGSVSGGGEMTAASPRITGRVTLQLSPEALPEAVGATGNLSGHVTFEPPRIGEGHVAMEVHPVGLDVGAEGDGQTSWALDRLCAIGEACEREFVVTLTWLDPRPETTVRANFSASHEVVYSELAEVPAGALISWVTTPFAAEAIEGAITAATETEQIMLDDAHPAAMRHVQLKVSSAARTAQLSAFVESQVTQANPTEVRISILHDDSIPGEQPVDASMGPANPFIGCPSEGDCTTGVLVLFELASTERGTVAVVEWALHTSAVFSKRDEVPHDAELSATVDGVVDVRPGDPTIAASETGSFNAGSSQMIEVVVNEAAMDSEALGGLRPQVTAILTVDGAPGVEVYVDGDPLLPIPGGETNAHLDASGEAAVFYPMRHCGFDADCTGFIWMSTAGNAPSSQDGDPPLLIEWSIELVLPYPGGMPPDGAGMGIRRGR